MDIKIVVIGVGEVGYNVVKVLTKELFDITIIDIDEEKCTGCGWCIEACEFGSITVHPEKKIVICDLCEGDPMCVKYCPKDALELTTLDIVSEKARRSRAKELFQT